MNISPGRILTENHMKKDREKKSVSHRILCLVLRVYIRSESNQDIENLTI